MSPTMSDRSEMLSAMASSGQQLYSLYDTPSDLSTSMHTMNINSSSSNNNDSSSSVSSAASAASASAEMHEQSSSSSLLATMNSFVRAVNEMDETILIPSRLQDIVPTTNAATAGVSAEDTPSALVPVQSAQDLLAFYHTLNAIKTELVQGASSDEEDDEAEDENDAARDSAQEQDPSFQSAKAFRHHLQGLFGVLKQLTGSAKLLTSRYQEEIGELASGSGAASGLSTFTL